MTRGRSRCSAWSAVTGVSRLGQIHADPGRPGPALLRHFGKATEAPGAHDRLLGADHLADVVFVDQSPIGKTARSNPVSYVGAWDSLRQLFAAAPRCRASAATPPASSASTAATAAALPAAARASSMWRCSS